MIKAQLINSDAELNKFFSISNVEFVPGSNVDIAIRLFSAQRNIRYIPESASVIVTLKFQTNDSITPVLEVVATQISTDDRGMWKVSLTAAQSATIIGGNIEVQVDSLGDGTDIQRTVIGNSLSKVILSGDC